MKNNKKAKISDNRYSKVQILRRQASQVTHGVVSPRGGEFGAEWHSYWGDSR